MIPLILVLPAHVLFSGLVLFAARIRSSIHFAGTLQCVESAAIILYSIHRDPWHIIMARSGSPQCHLVHVLIASDSAISSRGAHAFREILPRRPPRTCIIHFLGSGKGVFLSLSFERRFEFKHKVHIFVLIEPDQINEARLDHIGVALFGAVLARELPLLLHELLLFEGVTVWIDGDIHHLRPIAARPR